MPNWQAIQSPKDSKTHQAIPQQGVNVSQMTMGSWHANAHKNGVKYHKSSGGLRKSTGKATIRRGPYKKDKIFSPVLILIQ